MKKIKVNFWDRFNPCYDPRTVLGDEWEGTILDVLENNAIPAQDRIWAGLHVVDDRTLRLFAVQCAREVQHLIKDSKSIEALNVAEKFANGQATEKELAAARAAAAAAEEAAKAKAEAAWAAEAAAAAWAAAWAAEAAAAAWAAKAAKAARAWAEEAAWAAEAAAAAWAAEAAAAAWAAKAAKAARAKQIDILIALVTRI